MKQIVTVSLLFALVACASPEQRCVNMGYQPGTPSFLACYNSITAQQQRGFSQMQQGLQMMQGPQSSNRVICSGNSMASGTKV